jgi:hypothetical protein
MDAADPSPATALTEDLTEEVLLRLPPADPARLAAAALVCRRWRALLATPGFRRRFLGLHRSPPLLGVLCNAGPGARFVPTPSPSYSSSPAAAAFRPPGLLLPGWRALDARHGRVLLRWDHPAARGTALGCPQLAVWDPLTDRRAGLPPLQWAPYPYSWNAAVLCAAAGPGGSCDHLDCCCAGAGAGGHFLVVVVGTNSKEMFAHVYSSELGAWTRDPPAAATASGPHPGDSVDFSPSALVGGALYFPFTRGTAVLEYRLGTKELAVVRLPPPPPVHVDWQRIALAARTDGRLGFATADRSAVYLWAREEEACRPGGGGGAAHWARTGVIELDTLLPAGALPARAISTISDVVGFVDAIGLVFVRTGDGLCAVDVKSRQVTLVFKDTGFSGIFPYMNFHTPGTSFTRPVYTFI